MRFKVKGRNRKTGRHFWRYVPATDAHTALRAYPGTTSAVLVESDAKRESDRLACVAAYRELGLI